MHEKKQHQPGRPGEQCPIGSVAPNGEVGSAGKRPLGKFTAVPGISGNTQAPPVPDVDRTRQNEDKPIDEG